MEWGRWTKTGLQWFRGLKELCFTEYRDGDNGLRYRGQHRGPFWMPSGTQPKKNEVVLWFNDFAKKFPGTKIPIITAREYHRVKWSALNMEK